MKPLHLVACLGGALSLFACTRGSQPDGAARSIVAPLAEDASTTTGLALDAASASALDAAHAGMTEAQLLAYYRDGGDASDAAVRESSQLAVDHDFAGTAPVDVARASYRITLPDETATIDTERALRVDDQGDRATAMLVGTGLPAVPGTRVAARNGFAGLALVSPDGSRYRVAAPDDVQHWFLGASSRGGTNVTFHRTDTTVLATRGGLSLLLTTSPDGDRHPLTCRLFVSMILGGDPAASRLGCADAGMPVRVSVRARGWPALTFERTSSTVVQLPRRGVALPPPDATGDYTVPPHPTNGAFFAPAELAALPGHHEARRTLQATNALTREALVFVDDLALGWLAPGQTATFESLTEGNHHVRARSLDGLERSRNLPVTFPATVTLDLDPRLR